MTPSVSSASDNEIYVDVGEPGYVGHIEVITSDNGRYTVSVEYAEDDGRVMGVYFHGVDWFGEEDYSDDGWDGSTSEGQWL